MSIVSFLGCTAPAYRWETYTRSTPSSSTFEAEALIQERTAVTPAVTISSVVGYRAGLSFALQEVLAEHWPELKALGHDDTVNQVNRMGMAEEYGGMIRGWHDGGILDRERLRRIGAALGARYVLLPCFVEAESSYEDRFVLSGIRVMQTRIIAMKLSFQIWDAETGEKLYESFGGGIMAREVFDPRESLFYSLSRKVWWSMIEDLKQGKTASYYGGRSKPQDRLEPVR